MEELEDIHIGDIIKRKLVNTERSEAWLARKIDCDRGNLHRQLCKKQIAISLLQKISVAMKFDFFSCYSEHIRKQIV